MLLAKIKNNTVLYIGESSELFPNISFSLIGVDNQWLTDNECMLVESYIDHDSGSFKLESCDYYIKYDKVYTVNIVPLSSQDLLQKETQKAQEVRSQRNILLTQSDWTQVLDTQVDKAAWAVYRQALRDITLQAEFPFNIEFPVIP